MCRNNEERATNKGESCSRGTNSRLPFDVYVQMLKMVSLSKNNGDGYKTDVVEKVYSRWFKLYRIYLTSFNSANNFSVVEEF